MRSRQQSAFLTLMVVMMPTLSGASDEPIVTLSVGAYFDNGDYDQSKDTDSFLIPVSVKYKRGDWIAKLSTSYLRLDGPVLPDSRKTRPASTESGIGDLITSLSYLVPPTRGALAFVELTSKIKFPTADDRKGLGTGEADLSFQVDLWKAYESFTPFGTLGFKYRRGSLDNSFYFSLGGGYEVSESVSAGLIYDFTEASVSRRFDVPTARSISVDDAHELVPYLNYKLNDRMRLQSYGIIGLTNNAPDYGFGTQLSVDF